MNDPSLSPLSYWQPRVMRHDSPHGETFAIHEVYFYEDGNVGAHTKAALSAHFASVAELKTYLNALILQIGTAEIAMGGLNYEYEGETIAYWLEYIALPPIPYENVTSSS